MGRFAIVGVINTLIDFALFTLLFFAVELPILAANSIGYIAGTTNGFILNKYWTFTESRHHGQVSRQFPLFFVLYLIGLGISNLVVWLLAPIVPALLAKAISIGISMVWNFWSTRRFVYRPDAFTNAD